MFTSFVFMLHDFSAVVMFVVYYVEFCLCLYAVR